MTADSWPFDDDELDEDQWSLLARSFSANGILQGPAGNEAQPYGAAAGLQVNWRDGFVVFDGHLLRLTASHATPVQPNASQQARTDRLVYRIDPTANKLEPHVVQGTPGSGLPALATSSTGVRDLHAGYVVVDPGVTGIAPNKVVPQPTLVAMQTASPSTDPQAPRRGWMHMLTDSKVVKWWDGASWFSAVLAETSSVVSGLKTFRRAGESLRMQAVAGQADRAFATFYSAAGQVMGYVGKARTDDPHIHLFADTDRSLELHGDSVRVNSRVAASLILRRYANGANFVSFLNSAGEYIGYVGKSETSEVGISSTGRVFLAGTRIRLMGDLESDTGAVNVIGRITVNGRTAVPVGLWEGNVTVQKEGGSLSGARNVEFPAGRFTGAPTVVATTDDSRYNVAVTGTTQYSFNVRVRRVSDPTVPGPAENVVLRFIALQS